MTSLPSRTEPHRRGLARPGFGRSERINRRIVEELVEPEMRVLQIGCGTGTLAPLAASKGAHVTGFDLSGDTLAMAGERAEAAGFQEQIELHKMGITGLERFPRRCFDLVIAAFVLCGLSGDQRRYTLGHAHRVLKAGGRLVLADEVRPLGGPQRLLHAALRLPRLLVGFLLGQITPQSVAGLEELVSQAGFRIETAERGRLESLLYLVAVKEEG